MRSVAFVGHHPRSHDAPRCSRAAPHLSRAAREASHGAPRLSRRVLALSRGCAARLGCCAPCPSCCPARLASCALDPVTVSDASRTLRRPYCACTDVTSVMRARPLDSVRLASHHAPSSLHTPHRASHRVPGVFTCARLSLAVRWGSHAQWITGWRARTTNDSRPRTRARMTDDRASAVEGARSIRSHRTGASTLNATGGIFRRSNQALRPG